MNLKEMLMDLDETNVEIDKLSRQKVKIISQITKVCFDNQMYDMLSINWGRLRRFVAGKKI